MIWKDILFKALHVKSFDELSPYVRQRIQTEVQPLLNFGRPEDPAVLGKAWEIVNSCLTKDWLKELKTKILQTITCLAVAEAFFVLLIFSGGCLLAKDMYQRQTKELDAYADQLDEASRLMEEFHKKMAEKEKENFRIVVGEDNLMRCQGAGFNIEIDQGTQTEFCVPAPGTRWALFRAMPRHKD